MLLLYISVVKLITTLLHKKLLTCFLTESCGITVLTIVARDGASYFGSTTFFVQPSWSAHVICNALVTPLDWCSLIFSVLCRVAWRSFLFSSITASTSPRVSPRGVLAIYLYKKYYKYCYLYHLLPVLLCRVCILQSLVHLCLFQSISKQPKFCYGVKLQQHSANYWRRRLSQCKFLLPWVSVAGVGRLHQNSIHRNNTGIGQIPPHGIGNFPVLSVS